LHINSGCLLTILITILAFFFVGRNCIRVMFLIKTYFKNTFHRLIGIHNIYCCLLTYILASIVYYIKRIQIFNDMWCLMIGLQSNIANWSVVVLLSIHPGSIIYFIDNQTFQNCLIFYINGPSRIFQNYAHVYCFNMIID